MLELGAALLRLLGLAGRPQQLLGRLPLAYAVGLVTTGILAAELALADVPVGWVALVLVTVAALALVLRRPERRPWAAGAALGPPIPAYAALSVVAAFLAAATGLL